MKSRLGLSSLRSGTGAGRILGVLLALWGATASAQTEISSTFTNSGTTAKGTYKIKSVSDTRVEITFTHTLTNWVSLNVIDQQFKITPQGNGVPGSFDTYTTITQIGQTFYVTPNTICSPSGTLNITDTNFTVTQNPVFWTGTVTFDGTKGDSYVLSAISWVNFLRSPPTSSSSMTFTFGDPEKLRVDPSSGGDQARNNLQDRIADPVSVSTGAFYQNEVDLHVNGPFPIEIRRTYSNQNSEENELGYGWLSGYTAYIAVTPVLNILRVVDTDGSVIAFVPQVDASNVWVPAAENIGLINGATPRNNPLGSKIVRTTVGSTVTYEWQRADGSVRRYVERTFTQNGVTITRPYLDSWVDSRGNTLTFTIGTDSAASSYAKVTHIQSSNGSSVDLAYSAAGFLTTATASDGRVVTYACNYAGDLVSVQHPDGQFTRYQYATDGLGQSTHWISQETKPDGRILQNVYDNLGRVIQQLATVGPDATPVTNATFDYSISGQTIVRDAYNRPTVYEHSNGLQTRITDPLGHVTTQSWYTVTDTPSGAYANSLQSVTDHRGLVTTYKYDAQGNVIETKQTGDLDGDGITTHTATTTAIFNGLNRPLVMTNASGISTTYSYADANYPYLPTQIVTSKGGTTIRTDRLEYIAQLDSVTPATLFSKGLLSRKTTAFGSPDQAVTEYQYNTAGFVTQQKSYTGTSDPDVVTTFAYNSRGELTTSTDADGRSTSYTYDGLSRPLTKVVKDETGTVLGTWTTTYTGNGEVATQVGPRTGTPNLVTHTYDGAGRPLTDVVARSQAATDGSGVVAAPAATTSYVHDFFGNLTSMTDPNGNVTTYTYDAIGQMLSKSTASLRTESYQYEPGGKVSQYTNPLGGVTNSFYTATGQIRRQENPDGSVLEWRYYDDGRVQKEILRNASFWETVYDDIAHKVTRTLKNSGGTVLAMEISEFDLRGNLIRHTDPEGFVRTTTYDDLDRAKVATGPAAGAGSAQQTTTTIYGASAKTVTVQNALNETVTTTSDGMGRPVQTLVKAADGTTVRSTSYAYSADHNAVTVTQGTGAGAVSSTVFTDTADRTVLSVAADGKFALRAYDLNGNLLSSTDQLNQTTSYTYNGLDQAISQTLPDGTVTTFTYNTAGGELTRGMANGTLTHEQTYDNAGRKVTERLFSGANSTRQFSYAYFDSASPFAGLLHTVTGPRTTITTAYDDFLRPQTVTTAGAQAETNSTTSYTYDRRNLVTEVDQSSPGNAAGPATQVIRTYDGYGQLLTEVVTLAGATHSSVTQTWDAAGRRASLNEAGSTLPGPLFAYHYQADGAMTQVTANALNYGFSYADNGLLSARTNSFRTLAINARDVTGRILQQTTLVGGNLAMVENMTWRDNSTLNSYAVNRTGTGGWSESRAYTYNSRGQLLSEGISPAAGQSDTLNYSFDGATTRLGIRTDAKQGAGAPVSWESAATTINAFGRVTADQLTGVPHVVPANGISLGADHVDLFVDGLSQGRATHPGWADPVGAWSADLHVQPGTHTFTANAVHPSGQYTATATSTFTVAGDGSGGNITTAYDDDGNVTTRTWASGRVQTLTWDGFNRLVRVVDRDSANNGSDWSAAYDSLGRRLRVTQQTIAAGIASGASTVTTSIYDPVVEFLEIGVADNGAKAWKVYGPDLNGTYGSLQGTGGLEAAIVDAGGATTGVINDQFGNGVGSVAFGAVVWSTTRCAGYGPLPGSPTETLTDITRVAQVTAWRSRRIDATGFVYLGARYYEPTSGRFLSADPKGHSASMNLYDFANGDPVNIFDPDGRFGKALKQATGPILDAVNDAVFGTLFGVSRATDYARWIMMGNSITEDVPYDETDRALAAQMGLAAKNNWYSRDDRVANGTYMVASVGFMFVDPAAVEGKVAREGLALERESIAIEKAREPYSGIKEASRYLQEKGVSREQRVKILQSFEAETVELRAAQPSEFGMRFYDEVNAEAKGRFLFETFPASRESLALKPQWNEMTKFTQWQIREGSMLIEGRTAGQGVGLPGGQIQKFVPNLDDLFK